MSASRVLDKIDRKLLNLLQNSNLTATKSLAEKIHVSQPTCLRRIKELNQQKIISANVAVVNPFALSYGLTAFLEVSLQDQSDQAMKAFEKRMQDEPSVLQCYFVSGEFDYFLVIHVTDMESYYEFIKRSISGLGNVRQFQSRFPMKRVKFTTKLTFNEQVDGLNVRITK